jgi:hypothetical protein
MPAPLPLALPSCLMDCYRVLFPNLDFSRIAFFLGKPPGPTKKGFTMASGGPSPDIHIYLEEYRPCEKATFLRIAHELVHAVQIQGMTGGGHIPGSWATYYVSHFLGCGLRGSRCDNALEKEAFDYAQGGCDGPGKLKAFIDAQLSGKLPCDCKLAWPTPTSVGPLTYAEALAADPNLPMTGSRVGRTWCSLLNWPLAFVAGGYSIFGFSGTGGAIGSGTGVAVGGIVGDYVGAILGSLLGPLGALLGGILGALIGAYLGAIIGGAIGWLVGNLFSGPTSRIWFTAFDGIVWVIPDIPISQGGHTLTNKGPALAEYGGKLYLAYRSSSSDELWYNVFDGTGWLLQDIKITQGGHTKTGDAPALAVYAGKLYMAYKSSTSTDLWYNVFDGNSWLPQDIKITQGGYTKSSTGPALAVFNGKLYMAYKSSSDMDLWYNVFDGSNWLTQDIKITQNGHTKTSMTPALAAYEGRLYMAYRSSSSADLWYNVFDGNSWLGQDIKITQNGRVQTGRRPALASVGQYLIMAYRDNS